jgi:hypothetical protein
LSSLFWESTMFSRCWRIASWRRQVPSNALSGGTDKSPALDTTFQECQGRPFQTKEVRLPLQRPIVSRSSGFISKASTGCGRFVGEAETSHSESTLDSRTWWRLERWTTRWRWSRRRARSYEEVGQKLINGLILALSFGYAYYTVFILITAWHVDGRRVRLYAAHPWITE